MHLVATVIGLATAGTGGDNLGTGGAVDASGVCLAVIPLLNPEMQAVVTEQSAVASQVKLELGEAMMVHYCRLRGR